MAKVINKSKDLIKEYNKARFMSFLFLAIIILSLILALKIWEISLIVVIVFRIKYKKNKIKVKILKSGVNGEKNLVLKLKELSNDYTIISGLKLVNSKGRITEIDAVVIGNGNLFIIEAKNHRGYIYGDAKENELIHEKAITDGNLKKKNIKNPIKQSERQLDILKSILSERSLTPYINQIIVFTNKDLRFNIKNSNIPILKNEQLIEYISKYNKTKKSLTNKDEKGIINVLLNLDYC
ncbi:nuclease-related domain-containing protein [Helicovermis profundi]|uniref:Nuclease-related domain-containing protein n=1 Tax=Helicovermis profundi TaxID=3065157 RepID=A0AAU9E6D3_9FIRM|nr:nuclease-related domain-containing protein [Clostridia bacterium S502]